MKRVCLIGLAPLMAATAWAAAGEPYEGTWSSLEDYPVPAWFDDAKFGIFIHWGAYSEFGYRKGNRGYAEHTPKMIYADPAHYYPVLKERFGAQPPAFGYKDIVAEFKAEKWDPEAWAALFAEAGARYVMLTAEHHDGFALWDSDLTDWCATRTGPQRDLVGELGTAVRKRGMKYAPSYHRERHPGFFAMDIYAVHSKPRADIAEEIARMPSAEGLYGPFSYTDEFIADYVARWKEIQDKYRPDFMWLDDIPIFYKAKDPDDPQVVKLRAACAGMIADYLNAAREWGVEVYLNNKGGTPNWPVNLGCLEKDNMKMTSIEVKWENPATLATSYGYMAAEEENDRYQPAWKFVHLLADVVSKNGNLLLNIGPRGDGVIPAGMQARLRGIGAWLAINGEAIYGTRPWVTFGEGIVETPERRDPLGRHVINSSGVRYTQATDGSAVYAILLTCPKSVVLKSFAGRKVRDVTVLGSDARPEWELLPSALKVTLPEIPPRRDAYVLKVVLPSVVIHP